MITLEMCLDYIEHPKRYHHIFEDMKYPVTLSEAQKKFLGNLCEGKITDTPRCFGKTFIIKLYCECLDYYTDMSKYDSSIRDDHISLKEAIDTWKQYNINPYNIEDIIAAYQINDQKAMIEYKFNKEHIGEWIDEQN